MRKVNVGLLGFGTVGAGVVKILIEDRELVSSRAGVDIFLKAVADIDIESDRGISLDKGILIPDAYNIIDDPEIDIIVELIGGEGVAKEFILKAIANGKQVITANKALLAAHGNDIFRKAAEKGVDIAFEASVGGCMPIIKTLREALVGNRILSMTGILNGTCNYILTKLTNEGSAFEDALKDAQEKGFAEADPTLDIEGIDTAHKLAVLNAIAYGTDINFDDIYIEGITKITPMDIAFAAEFGYRIKLLAISKETNGKIEARVHPTMIPEGNLLAGVNGSLNAITVSGDAVEDILLYGRGAGRMPTASAVISDVVDLARILSGTKGRISTISNQQSEGQKVSILPMDNILTNYYIRFSAQDKPGVLSKISGILGDHKISIKSVHQKGRKEKGPVPIVMLTHQAKEADVKKALAEIDSLDIIISASMLIRIENGAAE